MDLFHGTQSDGADNIIGPPQNCDVSKGRGELGQGFYLGSEPAMAAALARGRGGSAAILHFSISFRDFVSLKSTHIKTKASLKVQWDAMRKEKTTTTFKFGVDVVVAPFATFDYAIQYKFESLAAQNVLNNAIIDRIL